MDTEQIRREMSTTRASIDQKLDRLTARTAVARQQATRAGATLVAGLVAVAVWSWWRSRASVRHARIRARLQDRQNPRLLKSNYQVDTP